MTCWRWNLASLALGPVCLGLLTPPALVAVEAAPAHAQETLAYVRKHGFPPAGYMGGKVFGNYEGRLPRYNARRKRIEYREWDVRPKAAGKVRSHERLITGSDGRAYYTPDHGRTFVEIR